MERVWGLDISLHRRKDEYLTKSGKVLENCHGEMANGGLVIIGSMGSDVVKTERERECVCCFLLHVSTSIIITIIIMTIVSRMYRAHEQRMTWFCKD